MECGVGGGVQHEAALQLRRSPVLLPLFLTCENTATVRRLPMTQLYGVSLWRTYVNSFHLCGSLCAHISRAAVAAAAPSAPYVVLLARRCFFSTSAAEETPRLRQTSFTAYSVVRRCRKAAELTNSKTWQFYGLASGGPLLRFPLQDYTNSRHPRALRRWQDTASSLDRASVLAAVAACASAFHTGTARLFTTGLLSSTTIPRCAGAPRGAWLSLSAAAAVPTPRSTVGTRTIRKNSTASATRGNGSVSLALAFRATARTIAAVGAQYSTAAAAHGREVTGAASAFVPSIPPPANIPPQSPLSASVHAAPQVRRPGSVVRMNEVIRHWWAVPAVGFNSILEAPVYRFELFHAAAPDPDEANIRQQMQDSQGLLALLAHDEALQDEPEEAGCIVLPNDIFGLPLRPDILYRCYWFYRCAIAGWTERMQLYKWEWPGSKRKIRPQCRTGMARLGWRKAPGHYEGVKAHPLRPHDQRKKINKRLLWQGLKIALSAKFAQGQLKVVDHFNLQSHKTKHCVQHLRRLLGRKCPSALLVHEGHSDVNDNFRYATAHILAVRRENVEGVNVYNLLKYRQLVITEKALLKLIYNIQTYPEKRGWLPRYATPDGKPAPVPLAVEGWNRDWKEKKEREKQAKFSKALLRERILKWKWSDETKGAIKIPRVDPFRGFRLARFSLHAPVMPWEKYEETYIDTAPLAEEEEDDDDVLEAKREWLQEQERLERLDDEDLPHAAAAAAAAAAVSGSGFSRGFRGTSNKSSGTGDASGNSDDSCSDSNGEDESLIEDSESDDEAAAAAGLDVEYLPPVKKYRSRPPEERGTG